MRLGAISGACLLLGLMGSILFATGSDTYHAGRRSDGAFPASGDMQAQNGPGILTEIRVIYGGLISGHLWRGRVQAVVVVVDPARRRHHLSRVPR